MATIDDLNAAINQVATDVSALLALVQSQTPEDFSSQVSQLGTISQEIEAVTQPAAPAADASQATQADAPQPNAAAAQG